MNPEVKKLWVDALRSGEFRQGEGALCRTLSSMEAEGEVQEFCCLGVLSELAHRAGVVSKFPPNDLNRDWQYGEEGNDAYLPDEVQAWAGIETRDPVLNWGDEITSASRLNDEEGLTLSEIADCIEVSL